MLSGIASYQLVQRHGLYLRFWTCYVGTKYVNEAMYMLPWWVNTYGPHISLPLIWSIG